MTRAEERLRDYFGAVADSVRPDSTAPLAPPRPPVRQRRAFGHRDWSEQRGWKAWGVPLVAGASVLAVVSLSVTLAGLTAGHRSAASPASRATGRPQYYAELDGSATGGSVVIFSSFSGAVIASVQKSAFLQKAALPAQPLGILDAVAAAPDDRTFYAEMLLADNQAWIFRFRVSGLGSVTGITRIPGGIVHAYSAGIPRLVVSPDGRSLALTATSSTALRGHGHVTAVQDEIVVIDLRAGTARTWQGGLYRPGRSFDIQGLSWVDSGRSLLFVPAWCTPTNHVLSCPYFVGSNGYSQVRLLNVSGSGASLAGSRLLLGARARVQQVVSDHDGHLDVLNLSGPQSKQGRPMTVTVEQFSAASGALQRVLYRHAYHGAPYRDHLIGVYLSADPSGRYLLLGLEFASTDTNQAGWIDQRSLRPLKAGKDDAELLPDAW